MPPAPSAQPLLPALLLALTLVTGLVDAVSYLALGRVFTANMTGNVVFLGFAAAGTPGLSMTRSLAALAAFLLGAVVGGRWANRLSSGPQYAWTTRAFGAEAALFTAAALVAHGQGSDLAPASILLYLVIVFTGFALGLRNATVRRLGVPDLTTTVLTLTLTGLAADSRLAGGSGASSGRRVASVAAMLGGAAIGALLLRHSVAAPLALCAVVSGCCAAAARLGLHRDEQEAPA